ncbi:aminoacyl-tRNA hydrolase [Salibacteraceae bacterium]|jgi:PTH1 family peptidyl-tRNA hydrolase|nr:aminoacyl-tRNA hydrolase [Crocinitomicaceae bacterium]MCH9822697.1 aminoacyl-tRNA hydrolase [Bacteroidota bacterium]MDA9937986.1 aminoacyl-tRNA hydrolase [Salibacteraceae bacterium]MDB0058044.1 aminoacyl-tRNA hydrolase [Salibacteraceae bacterium]|tara:strand:+ start:116646 stop:117209 length:564 start_codon:yes stop_codon:yes gene_type:complete
MKYLVVGLGNPGAEYENTRHNIGFLILDALASASDSVFSPDRYADVSSIKSKGRQFILIKPSTFMNLSGKAVRYWMEKEKIDLENIIIVTDDLALPFGKIRIRKKGSDGGHNGLKSINELLGTQQYNRLRFGIGSEFSKGKQVDYVLGHWNSEETKTLKERIEIAQQGIKAIGLAGVNRAMGDYNGR